ncbi:hypothetical protein E4U30_002120 [Claviceps sp. LM220 group G6]|nr:hypothetical protein E4U30_002120 [Claviceps sp. LM220 group G6]
MARMRIPISGMPLFKNAFTASGSECGLSGADYIINGTGRRVRSSADREYRLI